MTDLAKTQAVSEPEFKQAWNVVEQDQFKPRLRRVFTQAAEMLIRTLGPDGGTTIIENFGEVHITKDGWNIMKKIHFRDGIDNTIFHLITSIAAQVVTRVGDGTTSSIVSANELFKKIESSKELSGIRPKDLMDRLSNIATVISNEVLQASIKIDLNDTESLDNIYRLASVSTNGDTAIPTIIKDIYDKTRNPHIEYVKSRTNRTAYEIVEGYQLSATFIDHIFINNAEDGTCDIQKPLILMFNHTISKDHFDYIIIKVVQQAMNDDRRVVVIAPMYDQLLLNMIKTQCNAEIRGSGTTSVVYNRIPLVNNLSHEMYNDFAILSGASIIRENDFAQIVDGEVPLEDFVGEVDHMSIGIHKINVQGFPKRNESMYTVAMSDALSKFKKVEENNQDLNIITPELYELKKRISKLSCKMGVIHVGGNSQLEKTANFDLVEDAVRACESAFNYGFNIGGNLIIPITIAKLKERNAIAESELALYNLFDAAFREVFAHVIRNRFTDYSNEAIHEIVDNCVKQEQQFDLITEEYGVSVINPCHTDIEILKAATSIIALLVTSNQFVKIGTREE